MRRRTFLLSCAGLASLSVVGGCGSDDDGAGSAADASAATFSVENQDAADHTHTLTIDCRDLGADNSVSYVASGPHEHTVQLSRDQLAALAGGETVTISFTDGHSHTFVIEVPAGAC